jgi:hypothetical protein
MKVKNLVSSCFFVCASTLLYGQESANSAGGDADGSGGSVAFSVGQVEFTAVSNDSPDFRKLTPKIKNFRYFDLFIRQD